MSNGNCPNQSEDTDRLVGRDIIRPNDPNIRLGMLGLQPLMCTGLLLKVLSGNAADSSLCRAESGVKHFVVTRYS